MLAIVLAGAYRDKFGGDHIDDVRGDGRRVLSSGSRGSPGPSLHRLHGRRQDDRRPRRRRRARRAGDRHRPRARAAARDLDRGLLRLPRRARVPRGRGGRRRRGARDAARAGDLDRRRRDRLRPRARAAGPPHGRDARRRRGRRPGAARAASGGRWRATASASPRCTPSARRSTRRWPTPCCSTAAPRPCAAPRARCGGSRPA